MVVEQPNYPDIDPSLEGEVGQGAEAKPENPLLLAHRLLRGRYPLAITLGVTLGVIGSAAGYLVMKPSYQSNGIIQIAPTLPKVLYDSEESKVPAMFESFVSAQAQFVKTRRVLDMANEDEKLHAAGWPAGVEGMKQLDEAITAKVPRRGQIVLVTAEAPKSLMAQGALNAVLRAYKKIYIDERGRTRTERQKILENRQKTLQAELRSVRDQIGSLAVEFGADNIVRLHTAKVDELTDLDAKLREVDLAIAQAATKKGSDRPSDLASAGDDAATDAAPMVDQEALENSLASNDRTLADYLAQESVMQRAKASMESAGYGPQHRGMRELINKMNALRIQIDDRVAFLQEHMVGGSAVAGAINDAAGASLDQLQTLRARYQQLRDDAQSQAEFFATRRRLIAGLQSEEAEKQQLLSDTRTALERQRVESRQQDEATGRVTIASWGDAPVAPTSDKRLPAAGAGLFGGMGVGVGLIAMLGLLNPRCKYVDDLERPTRMAPLLGTLPNLNADEPDQDEMAALSVHQIRNVLELQHLSVNGDGRVFTITSATAGEGKTSLTMALGMSFAAAGQKTLILDADLVGRGVTKQLKLDGVDGVRELMESGSIHTSVHPTPVANLMAMPTGSTEGFEPKNMSREKIARIITQLRGEYEIVLIDTGPLMGSLEGNLVCALSDATVLVVTRGQRSKLVQASLARLYNIGGRCAGTVFNRALAADYSRSVSHASFQVASVRSSHQPTASSASSGAMIGSRALVQAVAGSVSAGEMTDSGETERA